MWNRNGASEGAVREEGFMWNARIEVWCLEEANSRWVMVMEEWKSWLWLRVSEGGLQAGDRFLAGGVSHRNPERHIVRR